MAIRDLLPSRKKDRYPARHLDDGSLTTFQREINSMFDEFFNSFGTSLSPSWWPGSIRQERSDPPAGQFTPQVDVSETDHEVNVVAELPGMDTKDVHVELENDCLVIKGEKKEEHEDKDGEWHRFECRCGSFKRVIPLPAGIEPEKAKAKLKKGQLCITIPKSVENRESKKSIMIESE